MRLVAKKNEYQQTDYPGVRLTVEQMLRCARHRGWHWDTHPGGIMCDCCRNVTVKLGTHHKTGTLLWLCQFHYEMANDDLLELCECVTIRAKSSS